MRWLQQRGLSAESGSDPGEWLLAAELQTVRQAAGDADGERSGILLLKYSEDWSYHQLAAHLGIGHSAVEAVASSAATAARQVDSDIRQRGDPMMTDDEKQWARLIDGELSCSEQRAFLAALDDSSNGWKRLALGLLEADAFRRELREALPNGPFSPAGEKVVARPDEGGMRGRTLAAGFPPHPNPLPREGGKGTGKSAIGQLALACAIGLMCLGLGMAIEHTRQPVAVVTEPAAPVATTFPTDAAPIHQTLKLVFADGPAGAQSVEVPVIEAPEFEAAKLLRQSALPDELRRKLEAQGYVIHEERTYVPVSLANGRQGIAPVSDVVIEQRPVAFQ
ncbi:MAG: hypothetical protein U0872_15025 [Planctomycetaceae bacterium]